MHKALDDLLGGLGLSGNEYAPPWGLASQRHFASIAKKYGCQFPPSFISYQIEYADKIPGPNELGWAHPKSDTWCNLAKMIEYARGWGVPDYLLPFAHDEGNFYCFDTRSPLPGGEYPVVFWDHDESDVLNVRHYQWPNFVSWLKDKQR
jgi:hypothetical protein